jgi:DNA polymerase-3 subunit delta
VAARDKQGLDALRRDLGRRPPDPVVVVEGEESLVAEEVVQALVEAALPAGGRDFNLGVFAGDDETGRQFLAQARSYPFMAERRVVVVRRFDKLALRERDETAFLDYLASPSPTTVLVLVAAKLDRRTTVAKTLDRRARIVEAKPLAEEDLPGWARRRLESHGLVPTPAALARLVDLAGPSLLDLRNEIDKLAARYADAKRIDVAEVEATVGAHRVEERFAVTRTLRPDDALGGLQAFTRVMETETEDGLFGILALLQRHVNDLLRVRLLIDRGTTHPGAIAKRLGKNPFYVDQLAGHARSWTSVQLRLWLRNLQRADAEMKSLRMPKRWILERVLLNSFLGRELA